MLPHLIFLGLNIDIYKLMFILGLVSVAVILFSLRSRFHFSKKQALFYSAFTLAFGYLSAMITAWLENGLLSLASNGEYDHFEKIRNYGIPMFLPLFYLLYSLLFRDAFRKLSDYIAPCVYSVMTFVKIGCSFAGCCYGEPDEHGIWNKNLGYRTFPVQLYDALSSLVIVIICFVLLFTFAKKHIGYVYPIGGMLFALEKGFWEIFRVHSTIWEKNYLNTGWTFWQFWMLLLFVCCLFWLLMNWRNEKKVVPDFDDNPALRFPKIKEASLIFNNKKKKNIKHKKRKK